MAYRGDRLDATNENREVYFEDDDDMYSIIQIQRPSDSTILCKKYFLLQMIPTESVLIRIEIFVVL